LFRVDIRERWKARSMILKKWLVNEVFDPEQPICEIEVDGVTRTLNGVQLRIDYAQFRPQYGPQFGPTGKYPGDFGLIRHHLVAEGAEIGPLGLLLELEGTTRLPESPGSRRPPLHAMGHLPVTRRDRYPAIFMNYREKDADAYAGRLHERLAQHFGEDEVFFSEFSIRSGEVWPWTIQQAVVHAHVMVALIGQNWLAGVPGKRRIDLPDDLVRREIVAAMDRGTTVVPVLLPEGKIPEPDDFAWDDELRVLSQFQFHRLTGPRHWKADVDDLIRVLRGHLDRATS
jgi:hypothetical protein